MATSRIRNIRLLSFGETLWDIIEGQAHIGGAAFNLAAHASRCGLDSFLATGVGDDELGRKALAEIDRLKVRRDYIQVNGAYPTGTVTVTLTAGGQPSYVIHRNVAWDFIKLSNGSVPAAGLFDVICFGTLVQRMETSRASLINLLNALKGVPAFYDVNLRQDYYSRDLIRNSLVRAAILKVNDGEVQVLSDLLFNRKLSEAEFCHVIHNEYPVKVVLVTMGEKGCVVSEGGRVDVCAGHKVKVVDTVGAGDAFSAAFLAHWLRGLPAVQAAEKGNLLGAYVASRAGAIPDYDEDMMEAVGSGRQNTE